MSSNEIVVFTGAEHRERPSSEPDQELLIPAVIMSKKKGMSLEDKRKTIVGIYHSTASGQILAFAGRDTDIQVIHIRLPTSRDPLLMHSSCLWLYTMYTEGCVQSQGDRVGSFQARSRTAKRQGC